MLRIMQTLFNHWLPYFFSITFSVTVKEFLATFTQPSEEEGEEDDYITKVKKHKTSRGDDVTIVMNKSLYKYIRLYLVHLHPSKGKQAKDPLFPTESGRVMSRLTSAVSVFNAFVQNNGESLAKLA